MIRFVLWSGRDYYDGSGTTGTSDVNRATIFTARLTDMDGKTLVVTPEMPPSVRQHYSIRTINIFDPNG